MDLENKVAEELQRMMTQNLVPISTQEDINEISDQLRNHQITLSEVEQKDPFVVDSIHKAMDRINRSE
ncbi:hypothetical protein [Bacillus suaedae]|uniref:Uncharacterized protein n=1 Tax=Halalkalibacter suaedae TaxID=2822140 RepID=A0A940WUS3_9BACI|nr:hypothetical protein [Bacillus suaedae]MBP3950857.1 hypothetical protein [Bacillus suaedae]